MSAPIAAAIRNAFAAGEFAQAGRLWTEYTEQLRQAILRGEATASDMKQAANLLASARHAVLVLRAHSAATLSEARAASVYARQAVRLQRRDHTLL